MSNIRFTMKDLDGTVMPYTSFVISTSTSANVASFTTNLNGEATVTLAAVSTPYYISKQDGTTESVIAYKFFVPESVVELEAEMLFVDMGKISTNKDTKSIAALIEAKTVAVNARNESFKLAQILGVINNIQNSLENVTRVKTSIDNLDRVFSSIANVDRIFTSIDKLDRVHTSIDKLDRVYTSVDKVDVVYTSIDNVDTVSANITSVNKTAAIDANVTKVANIDINVTKVANIDSNVTKVANIDTNVTKVANIDDDVVLLNTVVISYLGTHTNSPTTRIGGATIKVGDWYIDSSVTPHQIKVCSAINGGIPSFVFVKNMDAEAAKVAAESARDAALVGAGVYATEAAGRAAVADGKAFKVQGTADVAAYEYRRTNSTTSELIATYPSAQSVLQPVWAGKKNGWPDPFFQHHDYLTHSFAGRDRWYDSSLVTGTPAGWTKVANSIFNAYALRRTDGYNQTTFSGPLIWLDEINVVPGDTVTAYVLITGSAGGTVYSVARFTNTAGTPVSGNTLMTSSTGATEITATTTPKYLRVSLVVPANATKLTISPYNFSGSTGFDLIACWVFKGGVTEGPEWPSLHDSYFDVRDTEFSSRIATLESTSSSSVVSITALGINNTTKQINLGYTPYVKQQSVLGDGEMEGDAEYAYAILGYRTQASVAMTINALKCKVWASNALTAVDWRLWVRSSSSAFNMETTTPTTSGTVAAGSFPITNTSYELALPATLVLAANEYVFVMFKAVDGSNIKIRRWLYNSAITPVRNGFCLAAGSSWNVALNYSGPTTGYGQTDIKLLMQSEELRAKGSPSAAAVTYNNSTSGLAATTVQSAIDALDVAVDALAAAVSAPELVMPPYIFGVQGRECNVYFDNLHLADDASEYLHDVTSVSASGIQQQERWTWTPSGAVTSGSLVVSAHDKRTGTALVTKTAGQRAAASSAGAGSNKKVMVIGDSLVGAGIITQTLVDVAATDSMGITLLGTRGAGSNKHEGRGGWTIATYTSNYSDGTVGANPFWISGAVNFPQYLTDNSIATPDWVAIHLGINDVFGQTTDSGAVSAATTAFNALDTLITSIKAAGAGVKVALMLPTPPASSQDAFGANYGTGQTRWRFKRNLLLWTQALIARYAGQESNRIYIAPTNTAIDTTNNVNYTAAAPVNSRSSVQIARQGNGVHPAASGYQQIGDALWAFLKYYAEV